VREGDVARGLPVTPKIGRLRFDEAADDVLNDYRVNGKRSLDDVKRRLTLHLTPFFGGRRLSAVTTPDVRVYVAERQAAGASNATVNRELTVLKRAFSLALQSGKLLAKPHIPMLRENNARTGFFEADQLANVLAHLPAPIQPVIRFAAITGWRIADEVLPLEWRQVDFSAGEVRLDVGTTNEGRVFTTKNDEGRVFPITEELRAVLEAQHAEHLRLKQAGQIAPWVFFRLVAEGRGGATHPKRIRGFTKAWKAACVVAGAPGRIPHDLRRTAVRNLVRAGVPERVAMQMTGHKTRSVFERYNIVSNGDLRAAARSLDVFSASAASKRNPSAQGQLQGQSRVRRGANGRNERIS
jgi:integrase